MLLREIRRIRLIAAPFVHVHHTAFEPAPIFAKLDMNVNFLQSLKTWTCLMEATFAPPNLGS